jgi:hypothetical protein
LNCTFVPQQPPARPAWSHPMVTRDQLRWSR